MMQKFTRAWKPQLSLLCKSGSYRPIALFPRQLKTPAPTVNHVFYTTKSVSTVTHDTTTTTTESPPPTLETSDQDPLLMEFKKHLGLAEQAMASTSKHNSSSSSGTSPAAAAAPIDIKSKIQQLWHQYETSVRGNPGLERSDYMSLRGLLWRNKQMWGSEDRILQLLDDMKQQGMEWQKWEYNEFFLAKLYQSRYQDILDMYNTTTTISKQASTTSTSTTTTTGISDVKLSGASFNALLATYIKLDLEQDAAHLIKHVGDMWGVIPDIRDFDKTMRRCMPRDMNVLLKGRTWIARYGFDQVSVVDTNLQHLFRDKLVDDGIWIYEQLSSSPLHHGAPLAPSTYTLLIKNLVDSKKLRLAATIYDDMVRHPGGNKHINSTICSAMLVLYAHRRQADKAETVVRNMVMAGHPVDEVIYNQLIKVYFKARQTRKALLTFQDLQRQPHLKLNEVILNTMVDGLVINREIHAAHQLYQQILAHAATHIQPDMVTFNTLFKGFVKAKEYGLAAGVIQDMYKYHCEPDTVTYTTLIDSIFEYKQPKTTQELVQYVETAMGKMSTPNIYTFNAMINGWVRHKNMDEAENTLALLQSPPYQLTPTIHTVTNMIQGYVEVSNLTKAMQTFQYGVARGIKPDRAAYNFLITGFMDYDRIDDAVVCLQHMRKANLNPTKDTWNMLLDACVRQQRWTTGALLVKEIDASGFAITNPALRRNYLRLKNSS